MLSKAPVQVPIRTRFGYSLITSSTIRRGANVVRNRSGMAYVAHNPATRAVSGVRFIRLDGAWEPCCAVNVSINVHTCRRLYVRSLLVRSKRTHTATQRKQARSAARAQSAHTFCVLCARPVCRTVILRDTRVERRVRDRRGPTAAPRRMYYCTDGARRDARVCNIVSVGLTAGCPRSVQAYSCTTLLHYSCNITNLAVV